MICDLISLVWLSVREKVGWTFCRMVSLSFFIFSKNAKGIASLEVALAAVPATGLHFDDPRRLVGGDLRLSAIVKLRNPRNLLHTC